MRMLKLDSGILKASIKALKFKRKLRKNVSIGEKLNYLSLAITERINMPKKRHHYQHKTDIIGLACQYSKNPKLRREDFDDILNITIKDIVSRLS